MNRASSEARDEAVREELALTQEALVRGNPKSYPAWFHRRWLVDACVQRGGPFCPLYAEPCLPAVRTGAS